MVCKDCNDTGLIEVESIWLGRPYMENKKIVYPLYSRGDWEKVPCPCKEEE